MLTHRKTVSVAFLLASLLFSALESVNHPSRATIVVDEDPSVPLVVAMVVVASGSTAETPDIIGMSHLLEHLLFDGTTTRSRREIYDAFDRAGVLYNAFTREDFVAYFIVAPSEVFSNSFEVLCDMLFDSVIPDDELVKERKVVIEELTRDNERPELRAYHRFLLFALAGTPYMYPVIGYRETVSTVSRETIHRHYREIYQPQRMTFIFAGNLSAKEAYSRVSACIPDTRTTGFSARTSTLPDVSSPTFDNRLDVATEALAQPRLYLALPAPPPNSPESLSLILLLEHLNDPALSFQRALLGEGKPISSLSFSYSGHRLASWSEVTIDLASAGDYRKALDQLAEALQRLPDDLVTPDTLRRKARSIIVSDLYTNENLTYRAMNLANHIGIGRDAEFTASIDDALFAASPEQLLSVARKYFVPLRFRGVLFLPEGSDLPFREPIVWSPPASEVTEFTLANGMTLIVKRAPFARVFAAHLLTRHRLGLPAAAKPGVPELTFRMLFRTPGSSANPALEDFAGRLKVTDDPSIPFDDYYYSRRYGFVRLEAPMESSDQALSFFLSGISRPSLSEATLRDAQRELTLSLTSIRERGSYRAENALYKTLFGDSLLATTFPGDPDTVSSITLADILRYYSEAFRPENLIISVVSNLAPEEVRSRVEAFFTREPEDESLQFPALPPPRSDGARVHIPFQSPISTLYFVYPLPGYAPDVYPKWQVAALLLSDILQEEVREKRGLAYSVGAGVDWKPDYSLLRISMTTSAENTTRAVSLLNDLISGLANRSSPDLDDIERAINQYWGRHLRYHQSSINQAYFLGFSKYLTGSWEWDLTHINDLRSVQATEITQAFYEISDPALWTMVVAGSVNPFEPPASA